MCQIVVIKNNKKLEREFLLEQYSFNNDGIGFCWYKNRKWHWKKFMNFEEFYNFYLNCNYERAIIHFRKATSGSRNIDNVHPFLISRKRDVSLEEGVLDDDEILLMENGVTNEIFNIAKFILLEDLKQKDFSDTKTIAYVFKKLNIFDIREIALRIKTIDNSSRFVLISNKKVTMLGNFTQHKKNVLLSNGFCYRYGLYYYTYNNYTHNNKRRLDCSSEVEKLICEKLNTDYTKTNLRYDFDTNLFELEIESETKVFGFKGLKRFLRKLGVEESKIQEIIRKLKQDIEKEKNKSKNRDYYDYYYYSSWWR